MNNAKKVQSISAAIPILLLLLVVGGTVRAQETLRVGYWNIPPHVTGVVSNKPTGAAIGYFDEYIAPRLGVTVAWDVDITPPTRLMDQLRKGQKDAMIFLGKTEERTAYLHYPNPYLDIPQTFAFLESHSIDRVTDVSELYDLRVGFLVGGRLPEKLRDDRIHYDLIAGDRLFQRNVEKLLLGRVDAIYVPLTIAMTNILKKMKVDDQVKLVPIEFLEPVLIYTVFSKKTVSENLVERYNKALEAASKEQPYKDYAAHYHSRQNTQ